MQPVGQRRTERRCTHRTVRFRGVALRGATPALLWPEARGERRARARRGDPSGAEACGAGACGAAPRLGGGNPPEVASERRKLGPGGTRAGEAAGSPERPTPLGRVAGGAPERALERAHFLMCFFSLRNVGRGRPLVIQRQARSLFFGGFLFVCFF